MSTALLPAHPNKYTSWKYNCKKSYDEQIIYSLIDRFGKIKNSFYNKRRKKYRPVSEETWKIEKKTKLHHDEKLYLTFFFELNGANEGGIILYSNKLRIRMFRDLKKKKKTLVVLCLISIGMQSNKNRR